MGPFLFNSFSDGPTMVLPSHQDAPTFQFPSQQFHGASHNHLQTNSNSQFSMNGARYTPPLPRSRVPQTTWNRESYPVSRNPNPSRKRLRDEFDVADETAREEAIPPPVAPTRHQEPIYGEGMVLLNPQSGLAVSAESQTGTWYEEKSEDVAAANAPVLSAPALRKNSDPSSLQGRKLQRLDASAPGLDDISLGLIGKKLHYSGQDEDNHRKNNVNNPPSTPDEPLVDDFTHILGISWQRVESEDKDMAAAIRGWAKYIDKHYSTCIRDSKILLKHRGLNAYLVVGQSVVTDIDMNGHGSGHSQQIFYLFNENLCEAQLVARNWDTCLQNLRSVPMLFEDNNVVRAREWTPERAVEDKGVLVQSVNGDATTGMLGGGTGHVPEDAEMGMDIDS